MIKRSIFLAIGWLLGTVSILMAQTNFIPLERGDAVEREERLLFSQGVQLSGDYRFRSNWINSSQLPESPVGATSPSAFSYDQDIRFTLRSNVHRTVSINLELSTEQDALYLSDLRSSRSDRVWDPESQQVNIGARQAFLELNTHPRDRTRIGKQEINIGDRRGKVFAGVVSGFTQLCTVGTWCYEFGAAKLASRLSDWIYFLSLDYAFWNDRDSQGKALDVFRTEIFRIKYTESDIPLGRNNVPLKKLSSSTLSELEGLTPETFKSGNDCRSEVSDYAVNSDCKPVYYFSHEYEYWGIRLVYETPTIEIYGDMIGSSGKRRHYVYDESGYHHSSKVNGVAGELEMSFISGEHRYGLIAMMARGDEEIQDPNKEGLNYKRDLSGFYEIMPGTYKGTQFYFNGGSTELNSGTGLGHSINNTSMIGLRYQYDVPDSELLYRGGLYQLKRMKDVYNLFDIPSKEIGMELNNTLSFPIAIHAVMEFDVNLFNPGTAFSFDDHDVPGTATDLFFHAAARLFYSF